MLRSFSDEQGPGRTPIYQAVERALADAGILISVLGGCSGGNGGGGGLVQTDSAQVLLGERLFLETRFAEFFRANAGGDPNAVLAMGDPALDFAETVAGPLPGPFAGQSMNCAACHLEDELLDEPGGGLRPYADFARRSPIPSRSDGQTLTVRNSPPLAGASVERDHPFITHLDGEFDNLVDVVRGTLTGRNYGWLPNEASDAIDHVASIIRGDDGQGSLAADFGGLSYRDVLDIDSTGVPQEYELPMAFRIDVDNATNGEILDAVSVLIAEFMLQLEFAADENGEFDGSPYDRFLEINGLPRKPDAGELTEDYTVRLAALFDALTDPIWVAGGPFATHDQSFVFGPDEFEGAKIFFREDAGAGAGLPNGVGNCTACHYAPEFNDFGFHNVGVAQEEYDQVHGQGAFLQLAIPDLATRNATPDAFLPASPARPGGLEPFRRIPSPLEPQHTDLGVWNIFANDAVPGPQDEIRDIILEQNGLDGIATTDADILPLTVASFRTLGLRDLGHDNPYMHTGRFDALDDVLSHYINFAALARAGQVRNADPELMGIRITPTEAVLVIRFLQSLNEDYE